MRLDVACDLRLNAAASLVLLGVIDVEFERLWS